MIIVETEINIVIFQTPHNRRHIATLKQLKWKIELEKNENSFYIFELDDKTDMIAISLFMWKRNIVKKVVGEAEK